MAQLMVADATRAPHDRPGGRSARRPAALALGRGVAGVGLAAGRRQPRRRGRRHAAACPPPASGSARRCSADRSNPRPARTTSPRASGCCATTSTGTTATATSSSPRTTRARPRSDRHGVYPVSRPYIASIKALEALFGAEAQLADARDADEAPAPARRHGSAAYEVDAQAAVRVAGRPVPGGQRASKPGDPTRVDGRRRGTGARAIGARGPPSRPGCHRGRRPRCRPRRRRRPRPAREDLQPGIGQPAGDRGLGRQAEHMTGVAHLAVVLATARLSALIPRFRPPGEPAGSEQQRRGPRGGRSSSSCSPMAMARTRAKERRWKAVMPCSSIPRRWSRVA